MVSAPVSGPGAPGLYAPHPSSHSTREVQHLALHNGLYLQLSCVLRPVWGLSPSLPPALLRAVCLSFRS